MALARCILGKFLGVVCHCFPLNLDYPNYFTAISYRYSTWVYINAIAELNAPFMAARNSNECIDHKGDGSTLYRMRKAVTSTRTTRKQKIEQSMSKRVRNRSPNELSSLFETYSERDGIRQETVQWLGQGIFRNIGDASRLDQCFPTFVRPRASK
jgi:hypothetical protein